MRAHECVAVSISGMGEDQIRRDRVVEKSGRDAGSGGSEKEAKPVGNASLNSGPNPAGNSAEADRPIDCALTFPITAWSCAPHAA